MLTHLRPVMSVGTVGTAYSSVAPAPLGQRITCNLGSRTWRVSAAQSTSYCALATEPIRSTTMVIMDPLLAWGTCMYDKISGFCEPFSDHWSLQLNLGTNISAHFGGPGLSRIGVRLAFEVMTPHRSLGILQVSASATI